MISPDRVHARLRALAARHVLEALITTASVPTSYRQEMEMQLRALWDAAEVAMDLRCVYLTEQSKLRRER